MSEVDLSNLDFLTEDRWAKSVLRLLSDKGSLESSDITPLSLSAHLDEQTSDERDSRLFGSPLDASLQGLLMEEL